MNTISTLDNGMSRVFDGYGIIIGEGRSFIRTARREGRRMGKRLRTRPDEAKASACPRILSMSR